MAKTNSAKTARSPERPERGAPSPRRGRARSRTPRATVGSSRGSFASLNDEWRVDEHGFETPARPKTASQSLLFNETVKDGALTVDITLGKSLGQRWQGQPAAEANVMFRYAEQDQYYYAGVGAWGTKFHISKAVPGPAWMRLNSTGSAGALEEGRTYRFRVECQGSKMLLFESDTKVLEALDDDYARGRWGLHAWKTRARFEAGRPKKSPLQCFVAMPFAPELDGVFDLIERTVESYENVECVRADQLTVSRPIMEDVRAQIARADLVIVDLTGRNPNVYYEAGMAAAWKKDWIVLAQSQDDLTFDVEQIRSILYSNHMGGEADLEARLRGAIEDTLGLTRKASRVK